jgi:predicted nucleic acid-binding protein
MSGTDKIPVFYWDACVYLAWLRDEKSHGQAHLDAIAQILKENYERKNIIISSTLTLVEVLGSNMEPEKEKLFRKAFGSQDHIAYDLDTAIALKARELRDRFLKHKSGKILGTPDAIHLATALTCKARRFFTFDGGGKNKKNLGLLELDKDSGVEGLEITKPVVDQAELIN